MAGVLDELLQNVRQNDSDWKNAKDAIVRKGVSVPDGTPTSEYGEKILSIETGVDTSGDTVVPSALREGYTAHDAAGQEITGTIPDYSGGNTVEMTSPEGATLNTAGTYCEGNIEVVPKLQSKTATTGEIVTADDGYVGLSEVDTNPVFEAGKKSEHDAFWDAYQTGEYRFAGNGWNKNTFFPTKDIRVDAKAYFTANGYNGSLPELLERQGIKLSTATVTNPTECFAYSLFTELPEFDCAVSNYTLLSGVFMEMRKVHTIRLFKIRADGTNTFSNVFLNCTALVNLTIEGTIGQNFLNLSWSPLSKASIISVINALSDTTTGLTVTVRLSAVNTAFETTAGAADGSTSDEWTALVATKPNWTINLINS